MYKTVIATTTAAFFDIYIYFMILRIMSGIFSDKLRMVGKSTDESLKLNLLD